jgi:N-acetylmuramoyl-L-alanine amidase
METTIPALLCAGDVLIMSKLDHATLRLAIFVLLLLQSQIVLTAPACSAKAAKDVVIVLDVGHVAGEPGQQCTLFSPCAWGQTSARGVPEYEFNLKLAQRVEEELVRAGYNSTYRMVTRLGGTAGLFQRADRAKKMNADIFLSIHHDGVDDHYLKPWTYQGQQRFYYDDSQGFSLHVSTLNARYRESLALARLLGDRLIQRGLRFTTVHELGNPAGAQKPFLDAARGIYRRDELAVLSRTEMPAVLLEAGVIVNRDEELLVSTPSYQATIAAAVVEAVKSFCAPGDIAKHSSTR